MCSGIPGRNRAQEKKAGEWALIVWPRKLCKPVSVNPEAVHYRAADKDGDTIDFYLSPPRNAKATKRFLGKAVNGLKDWEKPETISTDKTLTYDIAIGELKKGGKLPNTVKHRQVKYLNNVIEADHGKLKQLIHSVHGFKSYATSRSRAP